MKLYKTPSEVGIGINQLLNRLDTPFDSDKLLHSISKHPNFPAPPAVIDNLTDLKIKTEAVEGEVHQIAKVELPALALRRDPKMGVFYQLVLGANDKVITVADDQGKEVRLNHKEFSTNWSGVLILVTKDQDSGDPDYKLNRKKKLLNQTTTFLSWLIGIVLSSIACNVSFKAGIDPLSLWIPYLTIKLVGLFISVQLAKMDLFENKTGVLSNTCQEGQINDCRAVLNSSSGKLFGIVGLSEIGLMYYSGGIFLLLMSFAAGNNQFSNYGLIFLGGLSLLALPFTIYSIIQQAVVIRKFCTLCLSVQGLLWLEAAFTILQFQEPAFSNSISQWVMVVSFFLLPGLVWLHIRNSLIENIRLSQFEFSNKWAKLDTTTFNGVLYYAENKIELPDELGLIKLGNPDGQIEIAMITDPTCPGCADAFLELEYLVRQYPENIDLSLLSVSHMSEIPISTNWLSLVQNSSESASNAIHDWYFNMKEKKLGRNDIKELKELYKDWLSKYNPVEADSLLLLQSDRNYSWCKQNIRTTPTLIINGYRLPRLYGAGDLKFFMEELLQEV